MKKVYLGMKISIDFLGIRLYNRGVRNEIPYIRPNAPLVVRQIPSLGIEFLTGRGRGFRFFEGCNAKVCTD